MDDVIKQAREAIEAAGGLVTPSDVAREFGMSEQAIAQRIMRGAFPEPVAVLGRVRVYLGEEVREFMRRGAA
jgi:predicted DNA-binding transcriptional regulator AlpA